MQVRKKEPPQVPLERFYLDFAEGAYRFQQNLLKVYNCLDSVCRLSFGESVHHARFRLRNSTDVRT